MRIVIDLQGAQSTGSRTRGIGRYTVSLSKAILRNRKEHEVFLVLSGLFPETIEPIREAFHGLLPQENIRVWHAPGPVAYHDPSNKWRRRVAERVREDFLASIAPDVVLVSSMFEGFVDDAVVSVGQGKQNLKTAVILYDLIPFIYRKPYLDNSGVESWYLEKIKHLSNADIVLSISDSAKKDGVKYLEFKESQIFNIATDADECFREVLVSPEEESFVRTQYGLNNNFVMYTGGIDHRKNIDGLIRAFASLPERLKDTYQLAIVCSAQPENKYQLQKMAEKLGLSENSLVLTGYVPEDHLLVLYNICSLFVFPSLYEGFGLPALEAMRCGAPVIGSNTSSVPEVIGWQEALFDPYTDEKMASLICRALTDTAYRADLVKNGKEQSEKFSWDYSAKQAIEIIENIEVADKLTFTHEIEKKECLKLAYVSPLPPERSGIADYSAELLPELAKHYKIEAIVAQDSVVDPWINENLVIRTVQWFVENSDYYDRVVYHFGNSVFHHHMFDLLEKVPGVVVLHDFFLSDALAQMEAHGLSKKCWANELYKAHGYKALYEHAYTADPKNIISKYPCSLSVIQKSLGVIVHSSYSLRLTESWFGGELHDWTVIPLMRGRRSKESKAFARRKLGISNDAFLVCTFGMLGETKFNDRLLEAWLNSSLSGNENCCLVFVGENDHGSYGLDLLTSIKDSKCSDRINITGWTSQEVFCDYLSAADVGVQLRGKSRGETSAAVLDCMNYGLPTIINANGSMADIDDKAVWKLPDDFTCEQLISGLEALYQDKHARQKIGAYASNTITKKHDRKQCAELYADFIERSYHKLNVEASGVCDVIQEPHAQFDEQYLIELANSLDKNFPLRNRQRQLLVDVSDLAREANKTDARRVIKNILWGWIMSPPSDYRVEPVYVSENQVLKYARNFTSGLLGVENCALSDEVISYNAGDVFIKFAFSFNAKPGDSNSYTNLRQQGVQVKVFYENEVGKVLTDLDIEELGQAAVCSDWNKEFFENKSKPLTLPKEITWRIEGPFDSSYSLALVNREIAQAMSKIGHQVVLHSTEGPGDFPPDQCFLENNPDLAVMHQRALNTGPTDSDVCSRNLYPPRVVDMASRLNFLHAYGWEESGFPWEWVNSFNHALQGISVMSRHVEKVMIDNGVTVPLTVSRLGIDHWERVDAEDDLEINAKSFRFLHVSSCFPRKGADVMLRAFGRSFRASDDVTLVIKTFPNPHNEIHRWLEEVKSKDLNFPDVLILEEDYTDSQLKALYEKCHVLVAPSRAEGFGLPMAEAMLSGLAVITTAWSGQLDFCTSETAWLVDYDFDWAQSHFGLFSSVWAEPDEQHLTTLMREVYQVPEQERQRKIKAGQCLLTKEFQWELVATRMVNHARSLIGNVEKNKPRIGWVTTWNTRCGIATYSSHLIKNIPADVTVLAANTDYRTGEDASNVRRCWETGDSGSLVSLSNAIDEAELDTLVIQFNYGFYDFDLLSSFLMHQSDVGRTIVLMMHSTVDPEHLPDKKLSFLVPALKKCHRILVHSPKDMNRLKRLGVVDNLSLFPHGVLDYEPAKRSPQKEDEEFIISSYGFFLPHKGLIQLIEAVAILREKGKKVRLEMVNAEYPVPVSKEMIQQAHARIKELGLENVVVICSDYLSDEESLARLSMADLIVFPYQNTGESSSAAVRYGLASRRPVAVTPLDIFEDVKDAVALLPGQSSKDIANGILDALTIFYNDGMLNQEAMVNANKWVYEHQYSRVGSRLYNTLIALRGKEV